MGEPGKCWESGWVGCGVRKSGLVTLSLDPQKQCGQIPFSVWVSVSSFGKRIERNQFGKFGDWDAYPGFMTNSLS